MNDILSSGVGFMATVFAVSSTIPQILKTIKTKKSEDISIWLSLVLIFGLGLWVLYGVVKRDAILIISNSISVLLNIIMLFLKVIYSRHPFK
ncbi:MAG TPA: SemiSWEET family transporter [Candidatus Nitrosocosmicus sp.]